jgi:hypothetical protein
MRRLAIALVHYPVLDQQRAVVTSAVTNLDVHDLARSARTYGCSDYFVVHPILAQRELVGRILSHWADGSSGRRIPDRRVALELVRVVPSMDDALLALGGKDAVEVWVTAAREVGPPLAFQEARARLEDSSNAKPVLVVFGTGWGLAPAVIDAADAAIEPIRAADPSGYNHLSVRAACAIALDRLRGARSAS